MHRTNLTALVGLLFLMVGLPACSRTIEPADDGSCHQTFEFGNYGCARFLVMIAGPEGSLPTRYRWSIRALPVSPNLDAGYGEDPIYGQSEITVTRFVGGGVSSGDTASFWVVVKFLDDVRPIQVGVPLPVFAADSALRFIRFAPVGQVPVVDTVRLTLRH